jgi:molybdopterin-biosynthesis enzyme MoeA-like protein
MSTFSSALNSFLTAAAGNTTLLSAAGNLFGSLSTQVSASSTAVTQAKALMQSIQLAVATGNTALITSLATSMLTTPGMPADIQAMAQLVIEKAGTPQVGQFVNLLQTTITNEAASNSSILNTLASAQAKVGG